MALAVLMGDGAASLVDLAGAPPMVSASDAPMVSTSDAADGVGQ